MEIFFGTKEENNKRREEEFLKLSPGERLLVFLKQIGQQSTFPNKNPGVHKNDAKGNFVLRK
jgi:hypothetical protein